MAVRSNNYDDITPESIKGEILADIGSSAETREGSYANTLVSPAAYQMWLVYQLIPGIIQLAFPDETSGQLIDARAADFGLMRTEGLRAEVTMQFTLVSGLSTVPSIPAGTVVQTRDGLQFVLTEAVAFSGTVGTAHAQAARPGRMYNVEANTITMMQRNVAGVTLCTNPAAAYGGTDEETDAAFLARYKEFLQRPISSGNRNHYIAWAKEISGIENAECVALWNGPGTVKVIVAGPEKAPVDGDVVADVAAHIEEERPVGATVTVVSVTELEVSVSATVTLSSGASSTQVEEQLEESLGQMLAQLPFGVAGTVYYTKVLALLLACDGVEGYSAFTVNGGTSNLAVTAEQTPVAGSLSITAAGGS